MASLLQWEYPHLKVVGMGVRISQDAIIMTYGERR